MLQRPLAAGLSLVMATNVAINTQNVHYMRFSGMQPLETAEKVHLGDDPRLSGTANRY